MGLIAVAFYETSWFKAAIYVLIAVIAARVVDFLLARRDRAMVKLLGKTPDRADRTRFGMIRRLTQAVIIIVGVAMALFQFPIFQALSGAILASATTSASTTSTAPSRRSASRTRTFARPTIAESSSPTRPSPARS